VLQGCVGVANVLLYLPVEVTLLHSAGAAALVLSVAAFNHHAWRAAPSLVATRAHAVAA
jgi:heme A synthase